MDLYIIKKIMIIYVAHQAKVILIYGDLYNKNLFKVILINGSFLKHIINWNNKYFIVSDIYNSIKIIDIESEQVVTNIKQNKGVICIKKIYYPIYGETLLIAARDDTIKLWII